MNRIKEIRERRGLSTAQLAALVGTSQPQITRLENGERKLTAEWMSRLAQALDCSPADLLAAAVITGGPDEALVCPDDRNDHLIVGALRAQGFERYKIVADSVENVGVPAGSHVLVRASDPTPQTGDIVIARLTAKPPTSAPVRIVVRQFVAPDLLLTNRSGANMIAHMNNDSFQAVIIGVVIPGDDRS